MRVLKFIIYVINMFYETLKFTINTFDKLYYIYKFTTLSLFTNLVHDASSSSICLHSLFLFISTRFADMHYTNYQSMRPAAGFFLEMHQRLVFKSIMTLERSRKAGPETFGPQCRPHLIGLL